MRKLLALLFLTITLGMAQGAHAGPFEDGQAAWGRGDYATALSLFRPLAAQGNASAQYGLGVMYKNGQGVVQDYVRAQMWFNLSASNGYPNASKNRADVATKMTSAQIAQAQELAQRCQASNYKNCD